MKKILVLGRMVPSYNESLARSDDTITTANLVLDTINRLLAAGDIVDTQYSVEAPVLQGGRLFSGFMDELLGSDLVIFNLTDVSPNVAYEFGIVQSLGRPYFFICSEAELPAYFQGEIGILNFRNVKKFSSELASHFELYNLLRDCFSSTITPSRFSRTQISEYFDGLALSDVSAASGLAAGYFRNSLRRFERTNGFFGRRCSGMLRPAGQDRIEFEGKVPEMYIAVEPPSRLTGSYIEDFGIVQDSLAGFGLTLVDFHINRGEDEADFRNFGGHILARREQGKALEPRGLVVLEVPTFLYALQYSAIYSAFFKSDLDGVELERRAAMEEELFNGMIVRVKRSIDYYYRHDKEVPNVSRRFKWTTLESLPNLLAEIGPRYL
ncbi:STING domain-containing protein [Pseudooceanicola nanhaiensis]|uniref:STING domain-containing protein n=1 Tax=Pseudooceanicola nanhaiensis TaxID=375761 RepID=UPI004058687D